MSINALSLSFDGSQTLWKRYYAVDIRWFFLADFQLHYKMTVSYPNQRIEFFELDSAEITEKYDLFPPMPFCYGKTETDRSLLCSADANLRLAVTADHPFTEWLLTNSEMLYKYYPRYFNQIVQGLQRYDAEELISSIDIIMNQLSKSAFRYGIDISACPKLTRADFLIP